MALRLRRVSTRFGSAGEKNQLPAMRLHEGVEARERARLDFVERFPEILAVAHRVPDLALLARRQRAERERLFFRLAGVRLLWRIRTRSGPGAAEFGTAAGSMSGKRRRASSVNALWRSATVPSRSKPSRIRYVP